MNGSGLGWVFFLCFFDFSFHSAQLLWEVLGTEGFSLNKVEKYGEGLSWLRNMWLLPPSLPLLLLCFGVRFPREWEIAFGEEEYPGGRKLPGRRHVALGFWQRSCHLFQCWNKAGIKDAEIVLRRLKLLRSIIKKIRLIKITFRIMTKLGGAGESVFSFTP